MRPILLGMNNPLSPRPEHALYPSPPNCTGHRIFKMLRSRVECEEDDYLARFDRRNLLCSRAWSTSEAHVAALAFAAAVRDTGATVVVLGEGPRAALGLPKQLLHPIRQCGVTWRQLPHPSGRCRFYNDPICAALAAMLLEELYEGGER